MATSLMSLSHFLDENKFQKMRDIQRRIEIEQQRAIVEAQKAEYAERQEVLRHENTMREILGKASLEAQSKMIGSIIDLQHSKTAMVFENAKRTSETHHEMTKMVAQALIQNKLSQAQHKRDMEKLSLQQEFEKTCTEIAQLYQQGKQAAAEQVVNGILEGWRLKYC